MKHYNLARNSSLARSTREESEEETAAPTGMSLSDFYLSLGKAAKSGFEAGRLTHTAYISRINELRTQYYALKAGA
jgi:hypothetical protein